ncbi:hypothetical protein JMJ35_009275 [Cladonia borealis]|uniref:F-box domain-containing protein n=1 Tax=Cladonia borealis TaxID=184061 RepID=A0AA39QUN9_9LECA|nr:hypothetical protein JMJ35_009275 [Cladonia borealis]
MSPLQAPLATTNAHHTVPPIARLPNEILHQIFSLLHPLQVANLRLACKSFSTIALQYLVPEIHLIFKPSSFDHLRLISEHPVLSQHVHTLFYEADSLKDLDSMKEWKKNIIVPGCYNNIDSKLMPSPPPDASQREKRAYRRHMEKVYKAPRYIYSAKQLKNAYEEYKHFVWVQNYMRQYDYNSEVIREAMAKLPKLKTIELSLSYCLRNGRSRKLEKAFAKGLSVACGEHGHGGPCGVGQLRSLLVGASDAGLEIETLRCGNVQWQFFAERDSVFDKLKHAVRCLRTLEFYITTRSDEDFDSEDLHYQETVLCAAYIEETGRLHNFISSAPQLENLTVQFDCDSAEPPARLSDLVGHFSWHSLRLASFNMISTTEEELMEFYERHAKTLREIRIDSMHLDYGSWASIFERIRKTLSLEKATICGYLTGEDPPESIYFGLPPECISDGDIPGIGVAIEKYLVGSDGGPSSFNFADYDGPEED